jgi:hypothetical protein
MVGNHVAQPMASIHDPEGRTFYLELEVRAGLDGAILEPGDIVGKTNDAVGIYAREVGREQTVGHDSRLLPRNPYRH